MELGNLVLLPAFGFCIGLGTNALAIRMLFRPYREVRFLGLRFQGTLPRRQADIARTVAHTVVSELLREERVAERIAGTEVRDALQAIALDLCQRYLGAGGGTPADRLGPAQARALEDFLQRFLRDLAGLATSWLGTEAGADSLQLALRWLLARTPAELLRGEEERGRRFLVGKARDLLQDEQLERSVRQWVAVGLVRLASAERPVGELLPDELRQGLLDLGRSAVPDLLRRFEDALLRPESVARIKLAVRSGIEDYLLETEGGLVKNLVRQAALVGQERINREADQLVDANLHRLRALIYEENNRAQVERGVEEALLELLRRTPAELMAGLPPQRIEAAYDQLAGWLAVQLRKPRVADAIAEVLEREFATIFHTPLGQLLQDDGGGAVATRWVATLRHWVARGGLQSLAEREAPLLARAVLQVPLQGMERVLTPAVVTEVTGLALARLLPLLAQKVPELLRIVDVAALIEGEILAFSAQEVEQVVLRVARRELRSITWWGGALGFAVGMAQALLFLWLP